MRCIVAPQNVARDKMERPILFLAGGISNCPHWQEQVIQALLEDTELSGTILNPRRSSMPPDRLEQIAWEFRGLQFCDLKSFWFCKATECPITLLEYGKALAVPDRPMVVGIEPGYSHLSNVGIQTSLAIDHVGGTTFEAYKFEDDGTPRSQAIYNSLEAYTAAIKKNLIALHSTL